MITIIQIPMRLMNIQIQISSQIVNVVLKLSLQMTNNVAQNPHVMKPQTLVLMAQLFHGMTNVLGNVSKENITILYQHAQINVLE